MNTRSFSSDLQAKIDNLKSLRSPIKLGSVDFDSPLILAPMAGICTPPFRLLMEDLGAGGTVSELISCHGINYENRKTLEMLKIDEREKNVGIQLFGDNPESIASAAKVVLNYRPKFIDINMGCPVRKVVAKGGGSALMKEIESLGPLFRKVKKAIDIPLTIKIRTGWDGNDINADKIEKIARDEGVEWVAIHGRTRSQQYTGLANWEYIEWFAKNSELPIIGNGDLHQPHQVQRRLSQTSCKALMIARGCLRNPFIFLESLNPNQTSTSLFKGSDYWEVIQRLYDYTSNTFLDERTRMVQLRKLIVWFAAGFPSTTTFRTELYGLKTLDETMNLCETFFLSLGDDPKNINYEEVFMSSGHG